MYLRENEKICEVNVSSNIVSISRGQLEHFKCLDKNIRDISLRLTYNLKEIKMDLENFESRDFVLKNEKQLLGFPWTVNIKISMQFEKHDETKCDWFRDISNPVCQKLEDEYAIFKQFITATEEPNTNLELEIINATIVKLQDTNNQGGIQCVENTLYLGFLTPIKDMDSIALTDYEVRYQEQT